MWSGHILSAIFLSGLMGFSPVKFPPLDGLGITGGCWHILFGVYAGEISTVAVVIKSLGFAS